MRRVVVEHRSDLPCDAATVWARVTTPEGIRHELRPVLSMTVPPGLRGRGADDLAEVVGRPLGRAWVLLLGVLPVDYDDMTIAAVDPGRSFHERSRTLSARRWEHERWVEPRASGGSVVRDRLTVEPRLLVPAGVARRVVAALFAHRHRRLAAWCASQRAQRAQRAQETERRSG